MSKLLPRLFQSFSFRVSFMLALIVGLGVTGFGFYLIQIQEKSLTKVLEDQAQTVADLIAYSSSDAMVSQDYPVIATTLITALRKDPNLAYIEIFKNQKTVLFEGNRNSQENLMLRSAPIEVRSSSGKTWQVGSVLAGISKSEMQKTIDRGRWRLVISVLAFFALLLPALIFASHRKVIRPIKRLEEYTRNLSSDNLNLSILASTESGNDEIGRLEKAFNKMVKNLNETTVSRNYIENIINSIPDLIVVTTEDFTVLSLNPAAKSKLGVDLASWPSSKGKLSLDYFFEANLGTLFKDNVATCEVEMKTALAKEFRVALSRTQLPDLTYVFVAKDLTEINIKNEIITNQKLALASSAKMSSLGEMASGIAHEINTPLSAILLASDAIKLDLKSNDISKELLILKSDLISSTCTRVANIVKGLLLFSRNADSDPFETVAIQKIVNDTLMLTKERFRQSGINLVNETSGAPSGAELSGAELSGAELTVQCRTVQISQVLLNLLNNSFDAVKNETDKWIKIEAKDAGQFVEILVSDSGPGIPQNIRSKIMDPFFSTKGVGEGTGLGLSISKGIVESHQGRLELDVSQPPTCFKIILPKIQPKTLRDSSQESLLI